MSLLNKPQINDLIQEISDASSRHDKNLTKLLSLLLDDQDVIKLWLSALYLEPTCAEFYFVRGLVKHKLHRYDAAKKDFEEAKKCKVEHTLYDFDIKQLINTYLEYDRAVTVIDNWARGDES